MERERGEKERGKRREEKRNGWELSCEQCSYGIQRFVVRVLCNECGVDCPVNSFITFINYLIVLQWLFNIF